MEISMEQTLIKITPSQVGMLLECPRCLWLYFNKGLRQPMGPFPSLPGGMDLLFKNYFDEYRKKNSLPPELEGKVDGARLFPDLALLDRWRTNMQGIQATFPEYGLFLKGAIDDLLLTDAGEVIVLDFKTRGFPTKENSHSYYQHQLDLYTLLFDKNDYDVASYAYLLFFWPKEYTSAGSRFESDLVKITVSPEGGRRVLESVSLIIKGPQPSAIPSCGFCRYRDFRA